MAGTRNALGVGSLVLIACTNHGEPEKNEAREPLPTLYVVVEPGRGIGHERFRSATLDTVGGKPVLRGPAFEGSGGYVLCEQVDSPCATALRFSPVIVEGDLRWTKLNDPAFGPHVGPKWVVEDCTCEVSREAWVPLTDDQMERVTRFVHDRDTLEAAETFTLPLSVVVQIIEGRPADQLDPFAADPERTRQPLWDWRRYWVIEATDDHERNRFVEYE